MKNHDWRRVTDETFAFICKCRRPDGGYGPSPDADYAGNSDTGLSDMAAVTYAVVLAKTLGRELPDAGKWDARAIPARGTCRSSGVPDRGSCP
jgi:hypothetical protein